MQTCQGKTKAGAACRAAASTGGLCFFHANPDSAKTFGQIGGRKNRRSVVDLQVPDNMSAADLRNVTAQAIRLLLSGDLHPREAGALTQLFNISGHPAISLPIPTSGLPIGLQLVGRRDKTSDLLAVAATCERALSA